MGGRNRTYVGLKGFSEVTDEDIPYGRNRTYVGLKDSSGGWRLRRGMS
jgi:hypothetical protein